MPNDAFHLTRRELVALFGASATLAGCIDPPPEKILPYVRRPPEVTPGVPLAYATATVTDGFAVGLIVESREGRPIKIEGHPDHPMSLGATRAIDQAALLDLYHPRRARHVLAGSVPVGWRAFFDAVAAPDQRGLRFLLPPQSSPLLGALFEAIAARHPDARFCFHAPLDLSPAERATTLLYGAPRLVHYAFRRAATVVALDADFTCTMTGSLRWARDFAARRRLRAPHDDMGRLYAVEPMPTPTGTLADHHVPMRAVDVPRFAAALLAAVSDDVPEALRSLELPEAHRPVLRTLAAELKRHRGRSVVVAGDQQPVATHLLAHLLNAALDNFGSTVGLTPSPLLRVPQAQSLEDLARELRLGRVRSLMILEGDPVHAAPADLDLRSLIPQVETTAHLGLFPNATSAACRWRLPASHFLESWGDARAYDGTVTFIQPLIAPLHPTRTTSAVLAAFAGRSESDYDRLRAHWRAAWGEPFEERWAAAIQQGFLPDTASSWLDETPRREAAEATLAALHEPAPGIELHFEPSPRIHDGRFADNGWLQELPHPLTKICWSNAAVLGPGRAETLGVTRGDLVEIALGDTRLTAPVYVLPGHADDAVTLELGYGRRNAESPAGGVDAYPLRSAASRHGVAGVTLKAIGGRVELPITQDHGDLHGREIALHYDLESYRADPEVTHVHKKHLPTLLPASLESPFHQWAMTIDTMICTGCSACVVACQAENNVPVVGPEAVRRGREMHWLRIDRYFAGPLVVHQPMLCQHCEKAPCEYVCPVNATVHSPDGLNEMVYNRCVGTRFCSNNCPYKVRRFNWFDYQVEDPVSMQHNPDVTVRERGVMEKCTYCVQRLRRAEIAARAERRAIEPGEVTTACAQACPTGAIQFGLLHHCDSEMVRWRHEPRVYNVLHQLGTRPRTQYLAKIVNPAPEVG